jgi:hypothetical protein
MEILLILAVVALLLGAFTAAKWLLIIALFLFVVGIVQRGRV